ncbi:MAG: beta-ketoacyl synthase N-terminal-like domain-containing protein, partial [Candidatus Njordarchaeales archaeon]
MEIARKVVITGIGVISSFGRGKEAFWEGLKSGRCVFTELCSDV